MRKLLLQNKVIISAYFFFYLLIWIGLSILIYDANALPIDVAENIAWSKHLQIAFDKHPFLGAFFIKLILPFSPSTMVANLLASSICLLVTLLYTYKVTKLFMSKNESIVIIILSSCGGIYTALNFVDYSQNSIVLPFWVMSCYYFTLAMRNNKFIYWVTLGLVCALGLYAKLEMGLIILCLALYLAFNYKKEYLSKVFISFWIFIVSLIPLIWWLFYTNFALINYALNRYSGLRATDHNIIINFLLAQLNNLSTIGIIAVPILCILILFKIGIFRIQKNIETTFLKRLRQPLVCYGLYPLLFFFALQTYKVHIEYGWLIPIMSLTLPAVFYLLNIKIREFSLRKIVYVVLCFQILVFMVYNLFGYFTPMKDPRTLSNHVALKAEEFWQQNESQPLKNVIGYFSIYITPFISDTATAYRNFEDTRIPTNTVSLGVLDNCNIKANNAYLESLGYTIGKQKCITIDRVGRYSDEKQNFTLYILEKS
ncbi:glycosyltransferase family 39 protein [Allofrancisella frigidaquae]|uniref:Glycosyltransferase family 39 protein n=1 Tax=Allofrancisella frigidaquae TaxID=1085644 RepID=A0A6M3HVG7_9GAMM|nr:glycosyltransferase family 39 protein [Allofrancisella frigidaquae]QIV95185.1 glycosyltransferase family 39 protein [Allofrancisella frigidaquae]